MDFSDFTYLALLILWFRLSFWLSLALVALAGAVIYQRTQKGDGSAGGRSTVASEAARRSE